jgi:catalase
MRPQTIGILSSLLAFSTLEVNAQDYLRNVEILKTIPLVQGLEYRNAHHEEKISKSLLNIFRDIQKKAVNDDGSLNRGTHARGSCLEADFKIYSAQELRKEFGYDPISIKKLKQGIFSKDTSYSAQIRFANAKGEVNSDKVKDVKGVGLSIDTRGDVKDWSGDSRQDYSANSTPMFLTHNIKGFHEVMKTVACLSGKVKYFPNPLYLKTILSAKNLLDHYETNDSLSYATEEYWGNIPSVHGLTKDGSPANVSKFKLTPCDGKGRQTEESSSKSDHYLQEDILKRANDGKVCFYYQVQIMDVEKLNQASGLKWSKQDWIENGGKLWPEEVLPFKTVAKISISKETKQTSCEGWYVNPRLHSNPQNMPIGSISRVRAIVEETSRARRQSEINQ